MQASRFECLSYRFGMALSRPKANIVQQQHFECVIATGGERTATSRHYKASYCCKVADVAIVAGVCGRMSFFQIDPPARARVGVVNARFGVTCNAGDCCHSANFTAGINRRECIGQYKLAYPTILVNVGGGTNIKGCVFRWIKISINYSIH